LTKLIYKLSINLVHDMERELKRGHSNSLVTRCVILAVHSCFILQGIFFYLTA